MLLLPFDPDITQLQNRMTDVAEKRRMQIRIKDSNEIPRLREASNLSERLVRPNRLTSRTKFNINSSIMTHEMTSLI